MKSPVAMFLLAVSVSAQATEARRPPHITGDQFIAQLRGGPRTQRLFDEPYALGYLAGVADSTQGQTWCLPSGLLPELADKQLLDDLEKRRVGSMPTIASAVLVEHYRAKYPINGSGCNFKARLTGDEFTLWVIGNHRKSGAEKLNPSAEVMERERFAEGYVGGVVDATQGTDWCAPARIKPDELDAVGYWSLLDQPAGTMPGNAATFLHQQFIAKYPCRAQP